MLNLSSNLHQIYVLLLELANEDEQETAGALTRQDEIAPATKTTAQAARLSDSTFARPHPQMRGQ